MSVSARAGDAFSETGIGVPMLGVNAAGALEPLSTSLPDLSTTNEVHIPAAATAAVLTYAAETGVAHVLSEVSWSYSAAPTGGSLIIADGADTIFKVAITAAGPNQLMFPKGKRGHSGRAMTVTLASGAGAVEGIVNATHYTVEVVAGTFLDFSDEMNSGLIGML